MTLNHHTDTQAETYSYFFLPDHRIRAAHDTEWRVCLWHTHALHYSWRLPCCSQWDVSVLLFVFRLICSHVCLREEPHENLISIVSRFTVMLAGVSINIKTTGLGCSKVTYMRFSLYPPDGLGALNGVLAPSRQASLLVRRSLKLALMTAVMVMCTNMWIKSPAILSKTGTVFHKTSCASKDIMNCLFPGLNSYWRVLVFMAHLWCSENALQKMKIVVWLWISNCMVLFARGTNTETDAGGKFTRALKQSPWIPGFRCVCVCVCVCVSMHVCFVWWAHASFGSFVMFHKSWPDVFYRGVSLCVRTNMPPFGELN